MNSYRSEYQTPEKDQKECKKALLDCRSEMTRLEKFAQSMVESEAMAKSILESAVDGIIIISSQGIIESFNPAAEKIFGWTAAEVIGQSVNILMPQPHRDRHDNYIRSYLRTGRKKVIGIGRETMAQRKDGSTFPIELAVSEVKLGRRSIFTGIVRDITCRRQSASALKASEERFRLLVETMNDGLAVQDAHGHIIYVNPRFCQILGYERHCLIGRLVSELMDLGSRIVFQNELKDKEARDGDMVELGLERDDGEKITVRVSAKALHSTNGELVGSFLVITDMTQVKRLQRQLIHSQKMEAVGRLAGGIAHDFNNLLMIIQGYADLALTDLDRNNPLYNQIVQINQASRRAEALTRQLLAFSRKQVLQPKVLSLLTTLPDIEQMLKRLLGDHIGLALKLDGSTGLIKADEGQIEQVIFNLVVNARDAMPDGGTLTIATRNVLLDERYLGTEAEIPPGAYVVLTVTDTGIGMDPHVQSRIFEPFFTTKEKGHGTGLGLSTAYGIIKQSGGEIMVYSEPGQGTSFKIYLPLVHAEQEADQAAAAPVPAECGHETILVVEDEERLREMIVTALSQCGYNVLEASDGPSALDRYARDPRVIDLVLTDVMMPKMNGKAFADQFLNHRPQTRILYMSGYAGDIILQQGALKPHTLFIHKPFTQKELIRTILKILAAPPVQSHSG
jgi:two-component system cell cycle sensor histidine kinase/response regulator CckA